MNDEDLKLIKETMMLDYSQLVMNNVYCLKEIERLNNIIEEIREYVKHKIVECYDEGSTIGEFYKICDIDSKIEELLHKGSDKE